MWMMYCIFYSYCEGYISGDIEGDKNLDIDLYK